MRLGSDSELFGIAPTAGREARHGKPAQGEVRGYLGELSGAYGLPLALVQALAQTESNFDTGHTRAKRGATHDDFEPENTGYGVMQVRDDQIGQTVPAPDGSAHKIGSDIKTNWRANARAGVALLAQQYQLATLESPFGSEQEHAQQAYAGYSGGASYRDRYLQRLSYSNQTAHPDDRSFLKNFLHPRAHGEHQDQNQPEGLHDLLYRPSDPPGHLETLPSEHSPANEYYDPESDFMLLSQQQATEAKQSGQANSQRARKQHRDQNHPQLSARDKAYLDKYYDAASALAKEYNVDTALVLGVGAESGFASEGTYLRTGDAFGMTGGSTKHMTTAGSPAENVKQFFDNYGNQIRGAGNNASAFMNALQGRDAPGKRVKGWKVYNSDHPEKWHTLVRDGINEMRQGVSSYLSQRRVPPGN